MIKVTPYYAWQSEEARREFERDYLRMIAAVTPFFPEDVLFDDPVGLAACIKSPRLRRRRKGDRDEDTELTKLMNNYEVADGGDLASEAKLAEKIVERYSDELHTRLYKDSRNGHVNREKLRELLLLRLRDGQVPEHLNFKLDRKDNEQKKTR